MTNLEKAIEKAKKAADEGLKSNDRSPFKATVDSSTNFLKAPVKIARIGVQQYYGYELGLPDRALDKIGVLRPANEVFAEESLDSFVNLVVTDDHVKEVTTKNVKDVQVGSLSGAKPEGTHISGIVTITDSEQIAKIQKGKMEVSVGYSHDLKEESGVFDGVPYEFVQTNIRANHLAIVDAGRCGPACKLTIDHKGGFKMIITVGDKKFDVTDEQLAQAILDEQAASAEALKKKDEEVAKSKEEEEEAIKKKDKAEAAKDALAKTMVTDEALADMVSAKALIIADARTVLSDEEMPECGTCSKDIQTAIIHKVMGKDVTLDKKSDDYIEAMYDAAMQQFKKGKKSIDKLAGDFKTKDGKVVTRDTAREKYQKDHLGLEGE